MSRHDHENYNEHFNLRSENVQNSQEEIMEMLDTFDALLADPYLPEIELNDILSQQAECVHRLELLRLQEIVHQEEEYSEYHHYYNDEDNNNLFHQEVLAEQQLEEQIREIVQFEAMQQQSEELSAETVHTFTERNPHRVAQPYAYRSLNRSFRGYILNPNQDETTDDSTNSQTATNETQLDSPGSSASILSADFGDDDVLPIEEKSCVICCVDYQHGDEIVRNANGCGNSRSMNSRNMNSRIASPACSHVFHTTCITSWVESSGKSNCPCCRSPFSLVEPT